MKNFQINLFIILALGLCGLCAFQWYEQTAQRADIVTLNHMVSDRNITIENATNSVATLTQQVGEMDARLTELKTEIATNGQFITTQRIEIGQLQFANANQTNEIAQYQTAVDTLTSKLKDAYADLEKQNSAITNLISQRDEFVKRFNESVKDRNDVVTKYNALAAPFQKQSAGGSN
jgi:chromosome segregation ATPase